MSLLIVPVDFPFLHHESHLAHLADVVDWIPSNGNDVGQLASFKGAEFVFNAQQL